MEEHIGRKSLDVGQYREWEESEWVAEGVLDGAYEGMNGREACHLSLREAVQGESRKSAQPAQAAVAGAVVQETKEQGADWVPSSIRQVEEEQQQPSASNAIEQKKHHNVPLAMFSSVHTARSTVTHAVCREMTDDRITKRAKRRNIALFHAAGCPHCLPHHPTPSPFHFHRPPPLT
jgi:hypothetical protein